MAHAIHVLSWRRDPAATEATAATAWMGGSYADQR